MYKRQAEQDTSILPIHRSMEDGEIYFFYNTSEEERSVTVTMQGDGAPFVLDTWTGEILPLANYTTDGSTVTTTITLAGNDAILFGIGSAFGTGYDVHAVDSNTAVTYQDGVLVAHIEQNGSYSVQTNDGKLYSEECTDVPASTPIH